MSALDGPRLRRAWRAGVVSTAPRSPLITKRAPGEPGARVWPRPPRAARSWQPEPMTDRELVCGSDRSAWPLLVASLPGERVVPDSRAVPTRRGRRGAGHCLRRLDRRIDRHLQRVARVRPCRHGRRVYAIGALLEVRASLGREAPPCAPRWIACLGRVPATFRAAPDALVVGTSPRTAVTTGCGGADLPATLGPGGEARRISTCFAVASEACHVFVLILATLALRNLAMSILRVLWLNAWFLLFLSESGGPRSEETPAIPLQPVNDEPPEPSSGSGAHLERGRVYVLVRSPYGNVIRLHLDACCTVRDVKDQLSSGPHRLGYVTHPAMLVLSRGSARCDDDDTLTDLGGAPGCRLRRALTLDLSTPAEQLFASPPTAGSCLSAVPEPAPEPLPVLMGEPWLDHVVQSLGALSTDMRPGLTPFLASSRTSRPEGRLRDMYPCPLIPIRLAGRHLRERLVVVAAERWSNLSGPSISSVTILANNSLAALNTLAGFRPPPEAEGCCAPQRVLQVRALAKALDMYIRLAGCPEPSGDLAFSCHYGSIGHLGCCEAAAFEG